MTNFLIYFYYRITMYYNNQKDVSQRRGNSFIIFCFAMIIHLKTIEYFLDSLIFNGSLVEHFMSFNKYTRRFIYAPLVTLPIFLFVYFYYKSNRKHIDEKLKLYQQETEIEQKKGKRKVLVYLVCTVILFIFSFTSSKW